MDNLNQHILHCVGILSEEKPIECKRKGKIIDVDKQNKKSIEFLLTLEEMV